MDEVVSQIIIQTTEVDSKTNLLALFALEAQLKVGAEIGDGYEQILIGSVADMNMKPLLRCDSDINIMSQSTREVAIPDGCDIPNDDYLRQLNGRSIFLYRIQSTQDPGYVHLVTSGRLECDSHTTPCRFIYKPDSNSGVLVKQHKSFSQSTRIRSIGATPRTTFGHNRTFNTNFQKMHETHFAISCNTVKGIPCPYWPSTDFCERPMQRNWPTMDTVINAVNMGCDLVLASDVNGGNTSDTTQWLLSFSRAETLLIHTWTPVQKIVYHLLRYFRRKCLPDSISISSYHLKTLMLWNCEKQPPSYWKANPIYITSDLISCLLQHVKDRWLSNYFIPQSNLFGVRSDEGDSFGSRYETVVKKLLPFARGETLAKWFLENYIKVAAEQFYESKSARMASDLDLIEHMGVAELMTWLKAFFDTFVGDYGHHRAMEVCMDMNDCIRRIVKMHTRYKLALDLCRQILDRLPQIDIRCLDFFRSVIYMQAASKIDQFGLNSEEESVGLVTEVLIRSGKINRLRFDQRESESAFSYFNKATSLLEFAKSCTTVEDKLLLDLSKAYFWKSLECADADALYCAVNAYLAAIFYQGKETKLAMDFCRLIAAKDNHLSCSGHTMQPQLLPIINAVLLTDTTALKTENQSRSVPHEDAGKTPSTDPLTPEIFACRLLSKIHIESGRNCTSLYSENTPGIMSDANNSSSQFSIDAVKKSNPSCSDIVSRKTTDKETFRENTNSGISGNVGQNMMHMSGKKDSQECNYFPSKNSSVHKVDISFENHNSKADEFSFVSEKSRHINDSESSSSTDRCGNQIKHGHKGTLGDISAKTIVYLRKEFTEMFQKWQGVNSQYEEHGIRSLKSKLGMNLEGPTENEPQMMKPQKPEKEMIYNRIIPLVMQSPEKIDEKSKAYSKSCKLKDTVYSRADVQIIPPAECNSSCDPLKLNAENVSDKSEIVSNDRLSNACKRFSNSKVVSDSCTERGRKSISDQFYASVATTVRQGVVSALLKAGVCQMTAFNKALQEDPDISQHGNCAYPYMALYHFNCGHFQAALEICNDMVNRNEGYSSDAILFNLICSPPFNILLTHELKMVVNECRSSSEIMLIDARVLGAYLMVQCLMNLERSAIDIARMLMMTYAILLHSHAVFEQVTSRIFVLLREKVFQRYQGVIIEDMDTNSLSVYENGVMTSVGVRHDGARITLYTERYSGSGNNEFLGVNDKYTSSHSVFGFS